MKIMVVGGGGYIGTSLVPRLLEWNHEVEALVALEKGYFREEGLEDVELIAFADDEAAQIDALAS